MSFLVGIFEDLLGGVKVWSFLKLLAIIVGVYVLALIFPGVFGFLLYLVWQIIYATAPIWLPLFLALLFWKAWLDYRRTLFDSKQKRILLEIKLPQIIDRSPVAMELALLSLHQTSGQSTWYDRSILGKSRPYFSLELVSVGGAVRFFIWTPEPLKDFIEVSLYGQYPGIEIKEVEDYTAAVPYFDPSLVSMHGAEFKFARPTFEPIKTYADFRLEENPKEEFKIDPITPALEFLGSLREGEQMWIQIVLRAYKDKHTVYGSFFKDFDFYAEGKAHLKKLRAEMLTEKSSAMSEEEREYQRIPARGENERLNSVDRKLSKQVFECAIRSLYLAKPDKFSGGRIGQMMRFFTPFSYPALNSIVPQKHTGFDFPWQDPGKLRSNRLRHKFLKAYRRRAAFFRPTNGVKTIYMSVEELASIFHFPGQVAEAPGLERITSKRAAPPPNLPG